jgi:hypothetical protein
LLVKVLLLLLWRLIPLPGLLLLLLRAGRWGWVVVAALLSQLLQVNLLLLLRGSCRTWGLLLAVCAALVAEYAGHNELPAPGLGMLRY